MSAPRPITGPGPVAGSQFSTILILEERGVLVETILFGADGKALGTERNFVSFGETIANQRQRLCEAL